MVSEVNDSLSRARAKLFQFLKCLGKDVLEDSSVDITERLDIEASSSSLVFPQAGQLVLHFSQAAHQVDGDILFPR